jgi:serine/threonine-protein kinase
VSGGERIGSILNGTYRLERLLGEGGMGTVYEAVHQRVPRRFAIKMLNPEILGNKEVFERFRREAEIASSLGSQHIVQVFDFNHGEDGSPYMVLELLEGHDLAKRIQTRGRMTLPQITDLMDQLGQALAKAHAAGIVHRDLKPANIFLTKVDKNEDFVKVLDFGISKVLHGNTGATRTGTVFGTPNYMSPEQAEGRQGEIDHRTDIFAVGAILYECVTGQMAFNAPTLIGTIYQVCHGSPQPIRSFAPEVPEAVERVLARAMAKQRDLRHADVESLREEFTRACADVSAQAFSFATIPSTPPQVVAPTTLSAASSERVPTQLPADAPAGGRGAKVAVMAAAAGVALGVGLWLTLGRGGDEAAPGPVAAVPVSAPAPAPAPATPAQPAVAAPAVTAPAAPTPAAAATVEIRLKLTPADAKVEVDGLVTTENPLRLPQGDRTFKVVVSAPGYVSLTRQVRPLMNSELVATLERPSAAPRPAPAKAKKKKVELEDW